MKFGLDGFNEIRRNVRYILYKGNFEAFLRHKVVLFLLHVATSADFATFVAGATQARQPTVHTRNKENMPSRVSQIFENSAEQKFYLISN